MKTSLVLTIIGTDQPGIVNQISNTVSAHGGNWHESRMAHLAGQFAGLMRAQVEADRFDDLCQALQALSTGGLQIAVVKDMPADDAPVCERAINLEVTGSDHPGIVRDISAILAKH